MADGPVWPEYAYTIWTRFGPLHFYYNPGNWPAQPWLNTTSPVAQGDSHK